MKLKKIATVLLALVTASGLSACAQADVIGKTSITSFETVLNKLGDKVNFDENKNRWVLVSPTGENFELSKDFSSAHPDAAIEFDAAPFIAAGLDTKKLPAEQYQYDESTGRLVLLFELAADKFNYSGEASPLDTFKQIVATNRELIGYHAQLDHFGISLGNGNMFEWAKDMSKNDKDIVFVLNPQPLIDAGVDPAKVEGWVFGKVKVRNEKKKMVEVEKFLKPFNLQ